jgi:hypothetical protein
MTARGLLMGRHRRSSTGSSASVSIHVRDLARMFNSLDPSPFWDRDLDRADGHVSEEAIACTKHPRDDAAGAKGSAAVCSTINSPRASMRKVRI